MKVIKMPNIKAIKCSACGCEYEYEQGDELVKVNKRNYWGDIPDAFLYFLTCPVCGRNNELCFDGVSAGEFGELVARAYDYMMAEKERNND